MLITFDTPSAHAVSLGDIVPTQDITYIHYALYLCAKKHFPQHSLRKMFLSNFVCICTS